MKERLLGERHGSARFLGGFGEEVGQGREELVICKLSCK